MFLATSIFSKNTTACLYKTSSSDGMKLSTWQIACQLSLIFCSQSLPIRLRPSPLTTRSVQEASWSVYYTSWNVSHNARRHQPSKFTRSKRKVKSRRRNVPITVSLRVNQVELPLRLTREHQSPLWGRPHIGSCGLERTFPCSHPMLNCAPMYTGENLCPYPCFCKP